MRILLIEDEDKVSSFLKRGLKEHKFVVDVARDGEEGLYLFDINPYDLIVLDLMIPKIDGITVCKQIREKKSKTPILMLTALNQINNRVNGLNAGADDYLAKPFAFAELLARIQALLRRDREDKNSTLKIADLEINLLNHEVNRGGKKIILTSKEYSLLEYMMLHSGEIVTRTMISEHVWNEDFHSLSNVIDVHVRYLRKKIDDGFKKRLIHTLRGTGYILKE